MIGKPVEGLNLKISIQLMHAITYHFGLDNILASNLGSNSVVGEGFFMT